MTQEEKLEEAKRLYETANADQKYVLESLFPELKESEDERIRKAILWCIETVELELGCKNVEGIDVAELKSWLEKQCEQKPVDKVEPKFKYLKIEGYENLSDYEKIFDDIADKYVRNKNQKGYNQYWYVKERAAEMLYQANKELKKKASWSEEDEDITGNIIRDLKRLSGDMVSKNQPYQKEIQWLKSIKDRVQPQPKQEWSEDDETKLNDAIDACKAKYGNMSYTADWLKSLKDRVQPQNKWISVDEEVYVKEPVLAQKKDKSDPFGGFVVCCDHTLTPNIYEHYMILGNIVSQNTWKPSDEQMEALLYEVNVWDKDSVNGQNLKSLYQDLKKLRWK